MKVIIKCVKYQEMIVRSMTDKWFTEGHRRHYLCAESLQRAFHTGECHQGKTAVILLFLFGRSGVGPFEVVHYTDSLQWERNFWRLGWLSYLLKPSQKEKKDHLISKHMPLFIKWNLRILKTKVEGNREDFQYHFSQKTWWTEMLS